jgi:hypothetical protein
MPIRSWSLAIMSCKKTDKRSSYWPFNHDNQESQLDYYTPDELRRLFANQPNVQIFDNVADGDFVKEFQKQNVGVSLWKYFLWAALLFLLLEILVIRFIR